MMMTMAMMRVMSSICGSCDVDGVLFVMMEFVITSCCAANEHRVILREQSLIFLLQTQINEGPALSLTRAVEVLDKALQCA